MFRLVLSCVVLGAALAKPAPEDDAPETIHSLRSVSVPQPLPLPDPVASESRPRPHGRSNTLTALTPGKHYIKSQNYPFWYPNNFYGFYDFKGDANQVISITCDVFNIPSDDECNTDSLKVNGQFFCGSNGPKVRSTVLEIDFKTNSTVTGKGYSCTIFVPSSDSVIWSLGPGQYDITTPYYGSYFYTVQDYPNDCDMTTAFRGRDGQVISITCPSFDVQYQDLCQDDYLSVDGWRFCGSVGPAVSGTVLGLHFHSNPSVTAPGFLCTITVPVVGGSNETPMQGTITGGRCCGVPNRSARIVGGVETEVNEYPWQAGLVSSGGTQVWCGGTVINNRYVLTAAHCTAGATTNDIQVLLREHRTNTSDGEMRFSIDQIIDHPSYTNAWESGYDFSLLKLNSTLDFASLNNKVAPACLPTGSSDFANMDAVATGWGNTSYPNGTQSNALREVTVQTMTNDMCRQAYGNNITSSMLCASVSGGGKDACQGDSGGPLVTSVDGRYTLIGVSSWGTGCALNLYPGVYGRVTEVTGWIKNNTADACIC